MIQVIACQAVPSTAQASIELPEIGAQMRNIVNTKKNSPAVEATKLLISNYINGRDGGIRTRDPLHPMQVRYQAALRPD